MRAGGVEQPVGAALADRRQLRHGDREEVAHEAERCAVEVAARLDPPVGQDHRVVDRRVELALGDRAGVGEGVERGAVHLRRAAQRVGVLHPRIALAVAGHDRRTGEQPAQVGRADRLADLRPQRLQIGGERAVGAEQRLDAHRRRHVGEAGEGLEVGDRQREHPEDAVGAVDERQPLLGAEHDRFEAGAGERLGGRRDDRPSRGHVPLADHHQRTVGERRQVAARAERAVLGHDGRQAGVEQRQLLVDEQRAGARTAHRQAAGAQQEHRPHDLALDGLAHAGRVRADQGHLQLAGALARGSRCRRASRTRW